MANMRATNTDWTKIYDFSSKFPDHIKKQFAIGMSSPADYFIGNTEQCVKYDVLTLEAIVIKEYGPLGLILLGFKKENFL